MIVSFPLFLLFVADAISAVGMAYDYETLRFSGADGVDELAFYSGNV